MEGGQRALPGFVGAFDALGLAMRELRGEAAPRRAHIAALPAVAQLWLAPRLPARKQKLILDMMRDMLGDDDTQN